MIRLRSIRSSKGLMPTLASSTFSGAIAVHDILLVLHERLKQRQRDQGHDIDDHAQRERGDQQLGRLAANELYGRVDAVSRDQAQTQPAQKLDRGIRPGRLDHCEDEQDQGFR